MPTPPPSRFPEKAATQCADEVWFCLSETNDVLFLFLEYGAPVTLSGHDASVGSTHCLVVLEATPRTARLAPRSTRRPSPARTVSPASASPLPSSAPPRRSAAPPSLAAFFFAKASPRSPSRARGARARATRDCKIPSARYRSGAILDCDSSRLDSSRLRRLRRGPPACRGRTCPPGRSPPAPPRRASRPRRPGRPPPRARRSRPAATPRSWRRRFG